MKTLIQTKPGRRRLGTIGSTVSVHSAEAGHKIREEFDEMAPKVTAAASDAVHTVTHLAAERSRPLRAEAASRGSAALSALLGEVTPAQIKKMPGRRPRRGAKTASVPRFRGRTVLLLAAAGGAVFWALRSKRSHQNMNAWLEEVSEPDPEPVQDLADPRSS